MPPDKCFILWYSRCPGLPASSLPVCPVYRCFFSCHPVTPVYRWYAGIPGWFIFLFHARGAPPAAAHSHTRCCTQHNTTRWVLWAAANTCLHTMPCAAGELCQLSDSTTTPEFSCCGPCGGRLHRICGDPDDDEEAVAAAVPRRVVVLQEMMSSCVPLNGWCCHAMDLVMNNDKHFMFLELLFQSSALLLVHLKHCCRN